MEGINFNLTEKELVEVKNALNILTNTINTAEKVYPLTSALGIDPIVFEFEKKNDKTTDTLSKMNQTFERVIAAAKNNKEKESDVNPGKNKSLPLNEEKDESLLLNIIGKVKPNDNQQLAEYHQNSDSILQTIEDLNNLLNDGAYVNFAEVSKIKNLHPVIQYAFKDCLIWHTVIHHTFNIHESILAELLENMDETDVSFISAIHNIPEDFVLSHPDLLDWMALLNFNQIPSRDVLLECFEFIPECYKSKTAIIDSIIQSSKRNNEEDSQDEN